MLQEQELLEKYEAGAKPGPGCRPTLSTADNLDTFPVLISFCGHEEIFSKKAEIFQNVYI